MPPVPAGFQVAIDCADPHRLASFWEAGLGYEVEDAEPIIAKMLAEGFASEGDITTYQGKRVWATAAACRHPGGTLPRLLFQAVPEAKEVKNRVHVDFHVGRDRRDELVDHLVALGATRLWEASQGPLDWVTLADPEGNEFCIT